MSSEPTPPTVRNVRSKDSCPHCGNPVGLSGWTLLPSRDNRRVLTCKSCGRHFDLSNRCKMASMFGGMLGMMVAVAGPFGWIVRVGHGSKLYLVSAVIAVALSFGLASVGCARLTLGLEPRP
jgi:hypothetical protein